MRLWRRRKDDPSWGAIQLQDKILTNEVSYIVVLREDQFECLRAIIREEVREALREERMS